MKNIRRRHPIRVCAMGIIFLASCTEAGLQPLSDHQNKLLDDKLEISGEVCTEEPIESRFPVKIMFIVDSSGSMQFTDPSTNNAILDPACYEQELAAGNPTPDATCTVSGAGSAQQNCIAACSNSLPAAQCQTFCSGPIQPGRQAAVQRVVDRFKNNPAVEFAIVRFNGRVAVNGSTDPNNFRFTRDRTALRAGIDSLAEADFITDYQGALSVGYNILLNDMRDPEHKVDLPRTKYVVMFLSDGTPDPACKPGCDNDDPPLGANGPQANWCDLPRDQWCDAFNLSGGACTVISQAFPAMIEPCRAYNTPEQVQAQVKQIIALGDQYGVGEIRFHAAFLNVPGLPQALKDEFGIDFVAGVNLVQGMAKAGNGIFRNFTTGQSIDFLDINYTSVARPFGMSNFITTNQNAFPLVNKLTVDSDGDGMDDQIEFEHQLNSKSRDSDGDGYGDKIEFDRREAGFDPKDDALPFKTCNAQDRQDFDGDGLNQCEESLIGTDELQPDTDRDRIPDGLEFIWNTDPLNDDANVDPDFDGKLTGEEIRYHSHPKVLDPAILAEYRYIYDITEQPERPDRRRCYTFKVRNVRLLTTLERNVAGTLGYNDIVLYFGQGPADDPLAHSSFRAACVRGVYVEPNYKIPADGRVELKDADFLDLGALRAKLSSGNKNDDPCVGAPLP